MGGFCVLLLLVSFSKWSFFGGRAESVEEVKNTMEPKTCLYVKLTIR
jgi:hypothetical protein